MKHGVLKNIHPEVGVCYHIPWIPGTPLAAPSPVPYNTFTMLSGTIPFLTSKMTTTTFTEYFGATMLQGTDVGPFVPHMGPPSLLLPFDLLGSASKSYFAVAKVEAEGKPVVASLLITVDVNLNCGSPFPTPTGFVVALTTHRVDMSWADILCGLATMACDYILQSLLSLAGGKIGDRIAGALRGPVMRAVFQRTLFNELMGSASERAAHFAAYEAAALANRSMARVVGYGVSFFMGGPMGADYGTDLSDISGGRVGARTTPGGYGAGQATTGLGESVDENGEGKGDGGIAGAYREMGGYMDDAGVPSL